MAIRLRTKKLIKANLVGAGVMLVISGAGGYFLYDHYSDNAIKMKREYKTEISKLNSVANQSQRAYALIEDIKKGEKITPDMVEEVFLPDAAAAPNRVQVDDVDTTKFYAKTDLKKHTVISEAVLYQDEAINNDERKAEYSFIELPTKLEKDQYVDIRIQFPSGEDYVVLSKKKVTDISGVTMWTTVDEGEILTISSAIVDAYVQGAKIYAIQYVDEHMQENSQMTYPVKNNVKQLIQESPNVVNVAELNLEQQNRKRLDDALSKLSEEDRQAMDAGKKDTDTKISEENEKQTTQERLDALANESSQQDAQDAVVSGGN
ncbi:hypothetical protein [Rummeliibacillus stabekisii]|uniref:hypothetical protein n=1 Tax=Rummeliibacillus stabekisii TaxID=241244 RepID=UPI001171852B|nr:hypothetical protein [Rummeliibacillus stabekisii]MBB5171585.1 hypothetical protein [Rummeliibacillus stabekisii]GEL05553.1 hypothetical protein RST01_21800 [Rummeliibacillus stabekisii]